MLRRWHLRRDGCAENHARSRMCRSSISVGARYRRQNEGPPSTGGFIDPHWGGHRHRERLFPLLSAIVILSFCLPCLSVKAFRLSVFRRGDHGR